MYLVQADVSRQCDEFEECMSAHRIQDNQHNSNMTKYGRRRVSSLIGGGFSVMMENGDFSSFMHESGKTKNFRHAQMPMRSLLRVVWCHFGMNPHAVPTPVVAAWLVVGAKTAISACTKRLVYF